MAKRLKKKLTRTKPSQSRAPKKSLRKAKTPARGFGRRRPSLPLAGTGPVGWPTSASRSNRFLDTLNLVSVPQRRFRAHFRALVGAATPETAAADALAATQIFPRPNDLTPRDWAVYLLLRAAQVEHALMVQYLFAAYSLKLNLSVGGGATTDDWHESLRQIAKEEMGHLLIVQNLLRLIGGPLCFEREEFPVASELYPFPFQLERLSKDSLAKYVFTEMSAGPLPATVISEEKRLEIEDRARRAAGVPSGAFINHVGTLYDTLIYVFENELQEGPDRDFCTDRNDWLAGRTQFRSTNDRTTDPDGTPHLKGVKALAPTNKAESLTALRIIAQQGEAGDEPLDDEESHFERFLIMYEQCPEDSESLTWPVVTNPNTRVTAPDEGTIPPGTTRLWAKLFDVRYRILLTSLAHALTMPAVSQGSPTPRKDLILWVYEEMTDALSALRDLAAHIVTLPVTGGAQRNAGPPFELPYSLTLPDQATERWRLHRDLVDGSAAVIGQLKATGESHVLLADLTSRDTNRRNRIALLSNSGF